MTATQIENILSEIGNYAMDLELPLKEVKYIYLTTDGCLYPGNDLRFKFHKIKDGGILSLYKGITNENGIFEKLKETPIAFVDFSVIAGFILNQKVE